MDEIPENIDHLMRQAAAGEFGIFADEARELGYRAFAEKYGHKWWLWGTNKGYIAVRHEGTDYLWRVTGEWDGWDGINLPPRESRDESCPTGLYEPPATGGKERT